MNLDAKVIDRLEELIARGEQILQTKKSPPPSCIGFDSTVDSQSGNQWLASSQNLLAKALGKDSEHYRLFTDMFKHGATFSPVNSPWWKPFQRGRQHDHTAVGI